MPEKVEVPRREGIVADSRTPAPAQVHRGAVALTTALRISTLLPREQEAIFSILRILNSADERLRRQEASPARTPRSRPAAHDHRDLPSGSSRPRPLRAHQATNTGERG
jgi:hypothetical protein